MLRGVREASGAAVLPESSLRSRGSRAPGTDPDPRGPHPRPHAVHLVGWASLQRGQAGRGETHAVGLVMRGVSVVVVGKLGGGVQEAAVAWEVAGCGGRVGRGLLALAPAGEGVELGVADVGQSGRGSWVVAGLRATGGGQGARGARGSSAGRGPRATGAAADGRGSPWRPCGGAVVGVVHGGAGGGAAFIMGRGSHVVVAIGGVLREETERALSSV